MRYVVVLAATVAATLMMQGGSAAAQAERVLPWCFTQNNAIGLGGAMLCHYASFEQCRASASGLGGQCVENPEWTVRQQQDTQKRSRPRVQ